MGASLELAQGQRRGQRRRSRPGLQRACARIEGVAPVKSAWSVAWSPPRSVKDSPLDSPVGGNVKTTVWAPGSRVIRAGQAPRGTPSTLTSVPSPSSTSCARAAGAGEAVGGTGTGGGAEAGGATPSTGGGATGARACEACGAV